MRSKLGSINRLVAAMLALVWASAGVAGLVVAHIYGAWVAAVAAIFALWYAALCDSMLMISNAASRNSLPAFLYVYVDDTNKMYRRALEAGAISLEEPSDIAMPPDLSLNPYGAPATPVRRPLGAP